ncbi:MAG: BrnT family toxin [Lachnospiraceae bacterium]|nr:BrnT family toxin [Lachnospiraceae bacterium]
MVFEWDPNKEKKNKTDHGIDFLLATKVFDDPYLYEDYDEEHSGYNKFGVWEDRYIAIGRVCEVLYVVYSIRNTKQGEVTRLISARVAGREEEELYYQWRNGKRV